MQPKFDRSVLIHLNPTFQMSFWTGQLWIYLDDTRASFGQTCRGKFVCECVH